MVEYANDAKVIAILDYLVFAMANSELLVPEQASIVKTNINSTLVGSPAATRLRPSNARTHDRLNCARE